MFLEFKRIRYAVFSAIVVQTVFLLSCKVCVWRYLPLMVWAPELDPSATVKKSCFTQILVFHLNSRVLRKKIVFRFKSKHGFFEAKHENFEQNTDF